MSLFVSQQCSAAVSLLIAKLYVYLFQEQCPYYFGSEKCHVPFKLLNYFTKIKWSEHGVNSFVGNVPTCSAVVLWATRARVSGCRPFQIQSPSLSTASLPVHSYYPIIIKAHIHVSCIIAGARSRFIQMQLASVLDCIENELL